MKEWFAVAVACLGPTEAAQPGSVLLDDAHSSPDGVKKVEPGLMEAEFGLAVLDDVHSWPVERQEAQASSA